MHQAPKGRNLAGIIPISGREDKLNLPWSDCLQPLGAGITAIENSVYECAVMKCNSIWIICNDDTAPLIRKRIGDYVLDPEIYSSWDFKRLPHLSKEYIPVFYVPVLQKDRNRRDTLGWSVLHGALTAFIVSKKISQWAVPTSYYVTFPYGIYNAKSLKAHRADIRAGQRCYVSHQGKTVRDNLYLPFSFTPEDWLEFRRRINEENTGGNKNLPLEERWSAKNFTLDKIFNHDKIVIDQQIEIEQYYSLDSWKELREYYRSDLEINKMPKTMVKPYYVQKEKYYEK
jgi:hypothetical protein